MINNTVDWSSKVHKWYFKINVYLVDKAFVLNFQALQWSREAITSPWWFYYFILFIRGAGKMKRIERKVDEYREILVENPFSIFQRFETTLSLWLKQYLYDLMGKLLLSWDSWVKAHISIQLRISYMI